MQVSRVKHITEGGKENCRCTFKIIWLAGPHVGERANVHCKSIYLLQFRNVENHHVLREAAKLLKSKKYNKSHNNDVNPNEFGIARHYSLPSVSVPPRKLWKKSSTNYLVGPSTNKNISGVSIVEDENGYIVCGNPNNALLDYMPGNGDEGWYTVSISLQDSKLMVHYEILQEKRDEEIHLAKL